MVISNRTLSQRLRRKRERTLSLIRSLPIWPTPTPATISQRRRRLKGKVTPSAHSNDKSSSPFESLQGDVAPLHDR